jgi:hypothetical protein
MVRSYGDITLTLILHSEIVQGVILLIVTYCPFEDSNPSKRKVHAWIGSAIPYGYAYQLLHLKVVPVELPRHNDPCQEKCLGSERGRQYRSNNSTERSFTAGMLHTASKLVLSMSKDLILNGRRFIFSVGQRSA